MFFDRNCSHLGFIPVDHTLTPKNGIEETFGNINESTTSISRANLITSPFLNENSSEYFHDKFMWKELSPYLCYILKNFKYQIIINYKISASSGFNFLFCE